MNAKDLFGKILMAEGVAGLQATPLHFEERSRDHDPEPNVRRVF